MKNIFDAKNIPQEARLYRILDEQDLLTRRNCKSAIEHIIDRIFSIIEVSRHPTDSDYMRDSFFEACYLELIYDYAKFVQMLPDVGLSVDVPLLERGLARASAMLAWFCPQAEALAARNPELGGVQKLVYVVFSAALLYEVGMLEQERVVHLTNHFGHFIQRWDPLMGPMQGGSHFKIRYRTGWAESLKTPLTHCFAKQLMPSIGVLWISDSPKALALWFVLLNDVTEGWNTYGLQFSWEEIEQLMQSYLQYPEEVETNIAEETLWGEIFWDWIKHSIKNNEMSMNHHEASAHVTEHGLILDADAVYENFNKYMGQSMNKVVVYQQFNYMGFTKLSGQDTKFQKYFSEYPGHAKNMASHMFSAPRSGAKHVISPGILVDQAHGLLDLPSPEGQYVASALPESWLAQFSSRFGLAGAALPEDVFKL